MAHTWLSARLKAERVKRGLTLKEAAAGAEINRHTLGNIEAGRQDATPATIRKLADFYELPAEELFEGMANDPLASPPAPSEPHIVCMAGEDLRRRAVGVPTILDRVLITDDALKRLLEGRMAWGIVETEAGQRIE